MAASGGARARFLDLLAGSGETATVSTPPSFTGCTDSLGGTDTFTTSGTWYFVLNPTGTTLTFHYQGAGFSTSKLPGCAVTLHSNDLAGSYNDLNKATFSNLSVPLAATTACGPAGTTGTVNAVLFLTPHVIA